MNKLFGAVSQKSFEQVVVEQATDPSLEGPDLSLNLRVVDLINNARDHGQALLQALVHRLQSSAHSFTSFHHPEICYLCLSLIEMTVKNCSFKYLQVCKTHADIEQALKTLIHVCREDAKVFEKALEVIRDLSDALGGRCLELKETLESQGLFFPQNTRAPPLQTPQRTSFPTPETSTTSEQPPALSSEYRARLWDDLEQVLTYLESDEQVPLAEVQRRLMMLIVEIDEEGVVQLLIELNEHVQQAIDCCEGLEEKCVDVSGIREKIREYFGGSDEEEKVLDPLADDDDDSQGKEYREEDLLGLQ